MRYSGNDGGGSEPITYYNCLASERSERGAPVRHPSSRRMASLPITSAVIANFSRPCLLLASRCRHCRYHLQLRRFYPSSRSPTTRPPLPPRYLFVLISSRKQPRARRLLTQSESHRAIFVRISARFLNGKAAVINVNHATQMYHGSRYSAKPMLIYL